MALRPAEPVSVVPATSLREVVKLLAGRNIGCVLVVFCDALMGIFTERDLLLRVGTRYAEVADEPIRHFMTPAPETLSSSDSVALALNRMAIGDFRHLPIEDGERVIGVTGVRDVLEYLAQQFPEVLGNMN
jgi:CBS domain-containing protein